MKTLLDDFGETEAMQSCAIQIWGAMEMLESTLSTLSSELQTTVLRSFTSELIQLIGRVNQAAHELTIRT